MAPFAGADWTMVRDRLSDKQFFALLSATLVVLFIWSGLAPRDRLTWLLEVAPAIIGMAILAATYPRFQAEMPLFNWLRDTFDLARNHYDRVGHLAQGFFPAIIVRELLIRLSPLRPGKWLFAIVTSVCLAISAFYEMIEWWAALLTGSAATAFLATQGDVGTRSGICFWRSWALSLRSLCLSRFTIAR